MLAVKFPLSRSIKVSTKQPCSWAVMCSAQLKQHFFNHFKYLHFTVSMTFVDLDNTASTLIVLQRYLGIRCQRTSYHINVMACVFPWLDLTQSIKTFMNRKGWISLTDRNYIPTVASLVSHPLHCWGVHIPLFYKALGKISLPWKAEVWDHSLGTLSSQGLCLVFAFGLLFISHLLLYYRTQERVTEGKKSEKQLKRHEANVPLNTRYRREDCLFVFSFSKGKGRILEYIIQTWAWAQS